MTANPNINRLREKLRYLEGTQDSFDLLDALPAAPADGAERQDATEGGYTEGDERGCGCICCQLRASGRVRRLAWRITGNRRFLKKGRAS